MSHRRWITRPEVVTCAVLTLSGCGRPTVRSISKYTVTIEDIKVLPKDQNGDERVQLLVHRDDCPTDRLRMTAWTGSASASCLRGLPVGKSIEVVDVIFKFPLMACRDSSLPKNSFGGCSREGVGFEQIGTPCPQPAVPAAPEPPPR